MILYDHVENRFAVERLDELHAKKSLRAFYMGQYKWCKKRQEPTLRSTRSHKSGKAWMHLLSNLEGVSYLKGIENNAPYEIQPGGANMLMVFNILFHGNAQNWNELGDMLSTRDCRVQTISLTPAVNGGADVKFIFTRAGYELGPFHLCIGRYHSSFKYPSKAVLKFGSKKIRDKLSYPLVVSLYRQCISSGASSGGDVAPLFALMLEGRTDVLRKKVRKLVLRDKRLTVKWMYHLLLSLPPCKKTTAFVKKAKEKFPELKPYYENVKKQRR